MKSTALAAQYPEITKGEQKMMTPPTTPQSANGTMVMVTVQVLTLTGTSTTAADTRSIKITESGEKSGAVTAVKKMHLILTAASKKSQQTACVNSSNTVNTMMIAAGRHGNSESCRVMGTTLPDLQGKKPVLPLPRRKRSPTLSFQENWLKTQTLSVV